jgi:D-glycero-alpha-D-manno-heptose-7-phosphate kinase
VILARAPLRIPLGGGGTDLPSYYTRFGGFFLSAAIDKHVYVAVNRPASDDLIRVKYSRSEEVCRPEEVMHDLVREALLTLGLTHNLEIASMADVPAGTGMGSSGSYLVALLLALHALKRDEVPKHALAEEACEIEIDLAGHPVGKQDQYVATCGGLNCYEIEPDGRVCVTPLRTPPYAVEDLERSLLLYALDQTRESASILGHQKEATDRGDQTVIDSLRRSEELGREIQASLEHGDLVRFGHLLDVHWQNKKARSGKVSNERVDAAYRLARESGALGGKVMGAGGGGYLMLLAPDSRARRVRDALSAEGLRQMPFTFDMEGAKVLLNL